MYTLKGTVKKISYFEARKIDNYLKDVKFNKDITNKFIQEVHDMYRRVLSEGFQPLGASEDIVKFSIRFANHVFPRANISYKSLVSQVMQALEYLTRQGELPLTLWETSMYDLAKPEEVTTLVQKGAGAYVDTVKSVVSSTEQTTNNISKVAISGAVVAGVVGTIYILGKFK